ncbi:MAG TPA: FMN-binding protein [Acidothermaceae bacterium]
MRRFGSVFVATVTGLVVLLSFKTTPAKAPRPVALSGSTPGASAVPDSSTPASSAPASSVPASSPQPSLTTPTSAAAIAPSASAVTPPPKPTPKPSSTTKTVTGSAVTVGEGRRVFGVVQVRLTLTNGKITAVDPVQVPQNDGHSQDLSSYSIPKLSQQVLSAQSASIDAVSGATYTSEAYAQSVQAALDAAKA